MNAAAAAPTQTSWEARESDASNVTVSPPLQLPGSTGVDESGAVVRGTPPQDLGSSNTASPLVSWSASTQDYLNHSDIFQIFNTTFMEGDPGVIGADFSGSFNVTNVTGNMSATNRTLLPRRGQLGPDLSIEFQIPMYAIIFLLSVVGNILVIVTVIQNKKMRSVTNVFLLNLSVSDLLLAVFCMPFTLVPLFLQNFIFGEIMCVAIRYLQGVSVATSCFTLVAISLERYFAICHPLKSRSWQTLSHSYKAIALCWVCALVIMMPLAVFHNLVQIGPGRHACKEVWPSTDGLKAYTVILNLFLLVFPIAVMSWAYSCVSYTLWVGMKMEKQSEKETQSKNGCANYDCQTGVSIYVNNKKISLMNSHEETEFPVNCNSHGQSGLSKIHQSHSGASNKTSKATARPFRRFEVQRAMRQSNTERSQAAKKRVIKMLFIIVLEFFVFWTPLYVLLTWLVFDLPGAYRNISPMTKSLFHLLSYVSACCNPITYCFMNKNFRQSFLMAFRCIKKRYVYAHRSQMSFSGNTASTRAPVTQTMATSYDKIVDSDDISENSF